MRPEIREFIDRALFCVETTRELSGMLPADDAELDEMIGAAVREGDADTVIFVVLAALHGERKVDGAEARGLPV